MSDKTPLIRSRVHKGVTVATICAIALFAAMATPALSDPGDLPEAAKSRNADAVSVSENRTVESRTMEEADATIVDTIVGSIRRGTHVARALVPFENPLAADLRRMYFPNQRVLIGAEARTGLGVKMSLGIDREPQFAEHAQRIPTIGIMLQKRFR